MKNFKTRSLGLFLGSMLTLSANAQDEFENQLDCLLEPSKDVELGFSVAGIVSAIKVDRGDAVKRGQAVAWLESEFEKVSVDLAKAKVEFAERKVARSEELLKDEFVSEFNVDEAVTELRIAQLEAQQAEARLRLRSLFSSTSGIVAEKNMSSGEYVSEAETIRVVEIDPLYVEVVVPIEQFGSIKEGMTATVFPEEPIGGEYTATVTIVDQLVDAASGTYGVRLELPNKDRKIPAGLKCDIKF